MLHVQSNKVNLVTAKEVAYGLKITLCRVREQELKKASLKVTKINDKLVIPRLLCENGLNLPGYRLQVGHRG